MVGCGSKGPQKPLPKPARTIEVRAPWADGASIPRRYTCDGADTAPAVTAPGARLAIVMTDRDAPGGTFVHWTRWDAGTEGRNGFGTVGYGGPCPPMGDPPHHYVVTVYELRHGLGLPRGASPGQVMSAIRQAAVASGSVTGTYERRPRL